MWSISAIIGVAVAGSVCLFLLGGTLAVIFERGRHRRLIRTQTAHNRRPRSTYHRADLSLDGSEYPIIPQPRAKLRGGANQPSGVIVATWEHLPSEEHLNPQGLLGAPEAP